MFARDDESADAARVTGATSFAGRIRWYRRALGFNPLVRFTDRLEALAVIGVLVMALVAIPLALSAGTLVRDAGVRAATEQNRDRHSVQALVVEGTGLPTDFDTPAYVRAQWREGTELRTDLVVSPATIKVGDHMTVWLDDRGKVVPAPLKPADAKLNGITAAVSTWLVLLFGSALAACLVRRMLDRSRDRAWERELSVFAHNDDGWANRHN